MSRRLGLRVLAAACVCTLAPGALGCSTASFYAPQVVARGELTLRYDRGFELAAAGKRVASGPLYGGLDSFVRCVPQAEQHARDARTSGRTAVAFSVLGSVLGVAGLVIGLSGLRYLGDDTDRMWPWVGGGIGTAAVGTLFAGLSWRFKNHANGHALDAMNFYNDSVGSLGATCDDLRYPAPAGPDPGVPGVPMAPDPQQVPPPMPPDGMPGPVQAGPGPGPEPPTLPPPPTVP